jgi:hypothetical protein
MNTEHGVRPSGLALAAVALAAIIFLVSPGIGGAATPTDRKIAALQRQVRTLQKQVKTIQAQAKVARGQQYLAFAGSTCATALTADLLQGTWGVIDQIAQATQGRTYFGPQQQLDDYRNCAIPANPSVPRPPLATPPSILILNPLLAWLHEG